MDSHPARPIAGGAVPKSWPWALLIAAVSASWFGLDLASEPRFVDESAYLSQTYFADLLIDRKFDDPGWLEYAAIDLPPLPKYLFGVALRGAGRPRFGPAIARRWYGDPANFAVGSAEDLWIARSAVVPLGALGCVSAFAFGTSSFGLRAGWLAAALLMIDPLYQVHSRRAMSDVPCESLALASTALGLLSWRLALGERPRRAGAILSGIAAGSLAGLAVLAKLSGGLALMTLGAWWLVGLSIPGIPIGRKLILTATVALATASAAITFLALNPMLWSHPRERLTPEMAAIERKSPIGRAREVMEFRADVSRSAMRNPIFRKDALWTPFSKLGAVVVQGFGRFGPLGPRALDSTLRYDPIRDRGALAWGPLVLLGLLRAAIRGRDQRSAGEPATAWCLLAQFGLTFATVAAFIPLAWDRYMLPIQATSAVLASGAFVGGLDGLVGLFSGRGRRPGAS